MSTSPLLTPLTFLCAATPFGRAAKRGVRGLGSVRRFAFGTLLGPEVSLRDWQRYQCAARRCRAFALSCEKLRFHQAFCLGAPNVTVGPSLLDARPKGVASKGGFGGVKRGQGNHTVPLPPFVSAGRPRQSPRRRAAAFPPAVGTAFPSPPGDPGNPPAAGRRHSRPPKAANSPPPWVRRPPSPPGGGFPRKPPVRFGQRTNFPRIFHLFRIAIDIFYFPWYS